MAEILDGKGNKHKLVFYSKPLELDESTRLELVDQLSPVTARGFLRPGVSDELREDVANHVLNCDRLTVTSDPITDEVTAFCAVTVRSHANQPLMHLEGIIVSPEHQHSGLAKNILVREIQATEANILAFHTQSEKMKRLGKRVSVSDTQLAIEIADVIHTGNRVENIDKGRYGNHSLYGDTEAFAEDAIQEIDWRHGDALIFAGHTK